MNISHKTLTLEQAVSLAGPERHVYTLINNMNVSTRDIYNV